MDPAFVAVVEPDLSPGIELRDDLDWQTPARQYPADRVLAARAVTQVHLIGPERHEPRHRQTRAPAGGGNVRCDGRGLGGWLAPLVLGRRGLAQG